MSYLLSICLPTKDRSESINHNIHHISTNIKNIKAKELIEIVISDNSKKINNYLNSLTKKMNNLTYVHSKDLGLDMNINNLIKYSRGKYIWFCQDHTRIDFDRIDEVINELNSNEINYLFIPTKENYYVNNFIINDPRYISFKNVYLNTNLVRKKLFEKEYNKLINKFNGSCLVFQHSIIYMNFKSKKNKIKILKEKHSDYKFFIENESYNKNTWSRSLENYLTVLEKSSLMFKDIFLFENIHQKKLKMIYCKNNHAFALLYQVLILQRKSMNFSLKEEFINVILRHPTFNIFSRFLFLLIVKNKIIFLIISKIYFLEFLYLIFSPISFSKRLINKFIN